MVIIPIAIPSQALKKLNTNIDKLKRPTNNKTKPIAIIILFAIWIIF